MQMKAVGSFKRVYRQKGSLRQGQVFGAIMVGVNFTWRSLQVRGVKQQQGLSSNARRNPFVEVIIQLNIALFIDENLGVSCIFETSKAGKTQSWAAVDRVKRSEGWKVIPNLKKKNKQINKQQQQ